jgi:hypothetical protein
MQGPHLATLRHLQRHCPKGSQHGCIILHKDVVLQHQNVQSATVCHASAWSALMPLHNGQSKLWQCNLFTSPTQSPAQLSTIAQERTASNSHCFGLKTCQNPHQMAQQTVGTRCKPLDPLPLHRGGGAAGRHGTHSSWGWQVGDRGLSRLLLGGWASCPSAGLGACCSCPHSHGLGG